MEGFTKREHPVKIADVRLGETEIDGVLETLKTGQLREGSQCAEFEAAFAKLVDAEGAVAMSSGTTALQAVYSYYLRPGDEVLVPAVSFFATASMVRWAGGVPVFCDIDPPTYCLDVEDARRRITDRTRAVAPVHLFGNAVDINGVQSLAAEFDLKVIWDAAQAHLTTFEGRDVGSLSGGVCYSFYATKNMTTGEGGMITSDDGDLLERAQLLKRQGQAGKYRHTVLGGNMRMTDMQAAIGLGQLEQLPELTRKRRRNAGIYADRLGQTPGINLPTVRSGVGHCYHQYTITLSEEARCSRDELIESLVGLNIQVGINYPIPLHQQPVFEEQSAQPELPTAEAYCLSCLSLPVQPHLEEEEVHYVADALVHLLQ